MTFPTFWECLYHEAKGVGEDDVPWSLQGFAWGRLAPAPAGPCKPESWYVTHGF